MTVWDPVQIVVGVDGSEQSIRAARVAAGMAKAQASRLHIVTVVRPPEGWWGVVGSPPPAEALSASMERAQRSVLDKTLAAIDTDGVEVVATEEIGDPSSALSAYCEQVGAGLLVVGRRGAGVVERLVLGSVADRLAHHAPCALMVVP
ncbi:MAG: universal stress protein [Acidimicrobiia bacterium]|jgi:nucleotide-binding universal stress UspA family protein